MSLATLAEFEAEAGAVATADKPGVNSLLASLEQLFLEQSGRADRPYEAARPGVLEVHDGTGTNVLRLQYPIADLTSLKLGYNPSDPEEELDVDDLDVVTWLAGKHRITRVDGGTFGAAWMPNYVHVTYDASADQPLGAKHAVIGAAIAIYRRRGSEGLNSERVGPYAEDFAELLKGDPVWQAAVAGQEEHHV